VASSCTGSEGDPSGGGVGDWLYSFTSACSGSFSFSSAAWKRADSSTELLRRPMRPALRDVTLELVRARGIPPVAAIASGPAASSSLKSVDMSVLLVPAIDLNRSV